VDVCVDVCACVCCVGVKVWMCGTSDECCEPAATLSCPVHSFIHSFINPFIHPCIPSDGDRGGAGSDLPPQAAECGPAAADRGRVGRVEEAGDLRRGAEEVSNCCLNEEKHC
jgi:hypothetical protein